MRGERLTIRPKLDPDEQHFTIPGPHAGLNLFLRYLAPPESPRDARKAVLYVHGATFPSALSIAHRFEGRSWRDELCEAGFHVWALDFQGYGFSDRYPEMNAPAEKSAPLCTTEDASRQLAAAVHFIVEHQQVSRISLLAHSWGSLPACRLAGARPSWIDRVVLFAPIVLRAATGPASKAQIPAWRMVTLQDQFARFTEDVPPSEPQVLSRAQFYEWGDRYLDTDPESRTWHPCSVKIPAGPVRDVTRMWSGDPCYDPARVRAPVCLLRGEWDRVTSREDTRTLFDALTSAPCKRDITLSRGTHLMHLESGRRALYRESICFLLNDD
jgi:alpha-beta hydrolase superfamily lysophospholipase